VKPWTGTVFVIRLVRFFPAKFDFALPTENRLQTCTYDRSNVFLLKQKLLICD
jgi:hypothetical protein